MKYELTEEMVQVGKTTLYRIKALVPFGEIEAGVLGGFIQSTKNLSQDGNAWVSSDAWVYGNAQVFGDAQVYGNAWVSGNARVCDNAQVCDNARVYGNAQVFGDAQVFGNARVSSDAWVCDNARVFGDAEVSRDCVYVAGLEYTCTLTDYHAVIGCEVHTYTEWCRNGHAIMQVHGVPKEQAAIRMEGLYALILNHLY